MRALRLWLFSMRHWIAQGYYDARADSRLARPGDRAKARAHEVLGDKAAEEWGA